MDAVLHLAGLSNDPLGELDTSLTERINLEGTIRLAELSKSCGIERFVFASSQSIYGVSDVTREMDEYDSEKAPVTAYALSKWKAELELSKLNDNNFSVVYFRPSTVFGASPRLRSDIVYNNFIGCAFTSSRIEIKSDGSPWRPVVHINDVANAFIAGLTAPKEIINGRAFNVGIRDGNFTVRELALSAKDLLPNSEVVFTGEHGRDARTYRVSFTRIFRELKGYYAPAFDLKSGGLELLDFMKNVKFGKSSFNGSKTNRLPKIKELLSREKINEDLRWIK